MNLRNLNNVIINDTILGNKYSGYLCGYYGSSNHTVSNNRRFSTTKKMGGTLVEVTISKNLLH